MIAKNVMVNEYNAQSNPQEIESRSFAIIESEVPKPYPFQGYAWQIARRIVHTCADFEILKHLSLSEQAILAGINALRNKCTVFTDTEMARCGMVKRHLEPLGVETKCIISYAEANKMAQNNNITRSRAGILYLAERFQGNIVAIGNAPTALLTLLECLDSGIKPPALIIGMPVGFVNAAESKSLLKNSPYLQLSIQGRKGGSTIAAATVNALAIIAKNEEL